MSIRTAAAALAATYTTAEPSPNTPDGPQCLRWVWMCYGSVQSNLPPLTSVAFAKQGWIYSRMQHPGDRNPPAGAPLYFTGSDGHICIATGNGEGVRSTEWPWGHVGDTSISAIEKAWGRTYYGWTGDILGHPIDFGTTTAATTATPIPNSEDYSMTQGAFYRLNDGQPPLGAITAGAILHQAQPGEPLLQITLEEWEGFAANHNSFVNLTTQGLQALVNLVGLFDLDPKTSRRVPAVAGRANSSGFSVYLP